MTKAHYDDFLHALNEAFAKHQTWLIDTMKRELANVLREDQTLREIRNDYNWIVACLHNKK